MLQAAIAEAEAAAADLGSSVSDDSGGGTSMNSGVTISMVDQQRGQEDGRRQQQVEVQWSDTRLQLSPAHYGKLRYMWEQRRRFEQRDSQEEQKDEEEEEQGQFAEDLFCLLLRYRTIRCSHFHAALPGSVFDWLREHFGANERTPATIGITQPRCVLEKKGRPLPRQAKDQRSFAKTSSGQTFKAQLKRTGVLPCCSVCRRAARGHGKPAERTLGDVLLSVQ
jgi:hypothetical protein